MKLNAAQLERTAAQLQAEPIPEDHPLIPNSTKCSAITPTSSIVTGLTSWNPRPPNWRLTHRDGGGGELGELDQLEPAEAWHEPELTESMVALGTDSGA